MPRVAPPSAAVQARLDLLPRAHGAVALTPDMLRAVLSGGEGERGRQRGRDLDSGREGERYCELARAHPTLTDAIRHRKRLRFVRAGFFLHSWQAPPPASV